MVERERIGKRRTVVDGSCAETSVCSESDIEVGLILFSWNYSMNYSLMRCWRQGFLIQELERIVFLTNQIWASNPGFVSPVERLISYKTNFGFKSWLDLQS